MLHGDVLIMQLKSAHHAFAAFDSHSMHSGIVEIACRTSEMNGFIMSTSTLVTRSPAIAEGPRDAGVPVEIW